MRELEREREKKQYRDGMGVFLSLSLMTPIARKIDQNERARKRDKE